MTDLKNTETLATIEAAIKPKPGVTIKPKPGVTIKPKPGVTIKPK